MSNVEAVRTTPTMVLIGGKERPMIFNLNSFAAVEEQYGDIDEALEALEKGSIKAIRLLLWAGLVHEFMDAQGNITISPTEVGSWLDLKDLKIVGEALKEALSKAMPELTEEDMQAMQEIRPTVPQDRLKKKKRT